MDIGRGILQNINARHRLDAGTFGTMGVGPGFAIAAALWCRDFAPSKKVICVEGDSAFGFSGMEVETMVRYKLPVVIIVVNNNGIYSGFDKETFKDIQSAGNIGEVYVSLFFLVFGISGYYFSMRLIFCTELHRHPFLQK